MHYRNTPPVSLGATLAHDFADFEVLQQIAPVVLIYGNGRRLHADEHNHGGRLLKTLDWIGREGIELRAVICGRHILDKSSLNALRLYLRHGHGLTAFRRVLPWNAWRHKYAWRQLCETLNLRWTT